MCGIAGLLGGSSAVIESLAARATKMVSAMSHRGPDAHGLFRASQSPLVLAHVRLAIIDLTPAGVQPMVSADGEATIVYNGEVYNFADLRSSLDSDTRIPWRGHSDTEVMLEGIARWGADRAVRLMNGMFAFAVWQERVKTLTLARDRLGVKPLYVARSGDGSIVFASELRTLEADPEFPARLNRTSLPSYFAHGYMPQRRPIFQDVVNLAPGSLVSFAATEHEIDWASFQLTATNLPVGAFDFSGRGWHYRTYWSPVEAWAVGKAAGYGGRYVDALAEGEDLLSDAVRLRMISDVPLGAFLSGGIDSSLVVALMQAQTARPVRTFSVGFGDARLDESAHAEAVARHLKTDHVTLRVGRSEATQVAERIGDVLDEPLADSSFIPTFLISELTRRYVTVAMTGDGGDEVLGGYWRYRAFRLLASAYAMPGSVRVAVDATLQRLEIPLPQSRGWRWVYYRLLRLIRLASQSDFPSAYRYATSAVRPAQDILCQLPPGSAAASPLSAPFPLDLAEQMMLFDTQHCLPDDLLVKVDRAAMAVSLECREPLLDYRFYEFAARLPLDFKLGGGVGKRLLRDILYRHVPRHLVDRPKQGFAVPLRRWLREDLKRCVEETLFDTGAGSELFSTTVLRKAWDEHQSGRWDHGNVLWVAFVLRRWLAAHRWS
jgi:asparagine synthase (glutamine-hydrolysing)